MRKAHDMAESVRGSLVELRRLFQRKELVELWSAAFGRVPKLDYTELRLLDAIRVAQAKSTSGTTVGEISRLLGIDPSRASRQVARAVANGLVRRSAAQRDGRKVVLDITPRGAKLQAKGSDLTRARIALAIDGWTAADRARFAELFRRFVDGMLWNGV